MATSRDKSLGPARITVRMLGRFEILRDDEPIPDDAWGRRKTLTLLKILLGGRGRVFSKDELIEALYGGEDPQKKVRNLQGRVSELRRALEPDLDTGADSQYILRIGDCYCFSDKAPCWLDTEAFREEIRNGQQSQEECCWQLATEAYEKAMELYQGDLLEADRYEEWAEQERGDLRRQHLDSMIELAACYGQLGRLRQAISYCQRVLALEPHQESTIRRLMEYQAEAGQRDAALETYREGERVLREYLKVEPSAELNALRDTLARERTAGLRDLDPRRIAVLPLQNYSSDPEDEYFADGMTEELIGALSKVRDLRVIARTSVMRFKETAQPISQIARALNVGSILEGSVRKAGDQVRISAQLIDARTEEHMWADEYDRHMEDILAIQKDVAREVAHALEIRLVSEERSALLRHSIKDVTAHTLFLKGRFFQEQRHPVPMRKGRDYLEKATELDPAHARAFAALADAHTNDSEIDTPFEEAYRKAKAAVTRALEIDGNLAEAHTALGLIRLVFESDSARAKESFDRAIALNPSYAVAYDWQGFRYAGLGLYEQAIASYKAALALDPLSPYHFFLLARVLAKLNRFDEAFICLDKALELNPTHAGSMERRIWCNHLLRDWMAADAAIKEFCHQHAQSVRCPRHRGLHLLYLGQLDESLDSLRRSCERGVAGSGFYHESLLCLAENLICARRFDESIERLEGVVLENLGGARTVRQVHVLFQLGVAYEQLERYDEARSTLTRANGIQFAEKTGQEIWIPSGESELSIRIPAAMGMVHAAMGQMGKAQEALDGLRTCLGNRGGQSARAALCFRMGLLDEGFEALDLAVDNHDWFILTIKTHPWFDPVRDDPRFADVLKRMNLAD